MQGRIDWLDGWRAVAVSLVIASHVGQHYHWTYGIPGKLGVFIFFFISGYIVTRLLLKEREATGRIDIADFYRRRALRILPPLLVYITICLFLGQTEISSAVRSLLFTCNITHLPGDCGWTLGHTWSLAFEEQYYLMIPVLLAGRHRWALALTVPLALLSGIFPINWIGRIGFIQIYMLLGLGAAAAFAERKITWPASHLSLIGLVLSGLWVGLSPGPLQQLTGLLVPFAIALPVMTFPQTSAGQFLRLAPIRTLGLWSYTLYLWQQLALTEADWNTGARPILLLAGAVCFSGLSYHTIERWCRCLAHRSMPAPSPA